MNDCFFVSVVIRNRSELLNKPVAVCHSDNPRGTAEISSANYPARDHGVKAGMFVKEAKMRCSQLAIVPYDFGAYEKVADQFYGILHKHCNKVQVVSCDEAVLDVSESEIGDPQLLASMIRKEIFDATGCTASAGIAGNMLLARLATRTAKPDGQCYIPHEKESLQKDFGKKTREMLWNSSRGIDNCLVGVIQSLTGYTVFAVKRRSPTGAKDQLGRLDRESGQVKKNKLCMRAIGQIGAVGTQMHQHYRCIPGDPDRR